MNLRFIERDGKKILQQEFWVAKTIETESGGLEWRDIPTFKEPEKKIEITEKELEGLIYTFKGYFQHDYEVVSIVRNICKKAGF